MFAGQAGDSHELALASEDSSPSRLHRAATVASGRNRPGRFSPVVCAPISVATSLIHAQTGNLGGAEAVAPCVAALVGFQTSLKDRYQAMSFSMTDGGPSPAVNATRLRRQLVEQAIAAATDADWDVGSRHQRADSRIWTRRRIGKSSGPRLLGDGRAVVAREHYQAAWGSTPPTGSRNATSVGFAC